jgi:hypothetical protein
MLYRKGSASGTHYEHKKAGPRWRVGSEFLFSLAAAMNLLTESILQFETVIAAGARVQRPELRHHAIGQRRCEIHEI